MSLTTELQCQNTCKCEQLENRGIWLATKPAQGIGLTKVIGLSFDDPSTCWEYTSCKDIKKALLQENSAWFQQAIESAPFLNPPLYAEVGHVGLNPFTEHILDHGTFPPFLFIF